MTAWEESGKKTAVLVLDADNQDVSALSRAQISR
jgi:hypothetical protein